MQLNNQRWIVVWFGIGVGVEVRVVRVDLLRLKLSNSPTPSTGRFHGRAPVMLGECSVEGFVWRSCFVGDRVDLVLRRDGTRIVPKPPRRLARWSLDLFTPSIHLWMDRCGVATQQSTVDCCLVRKWCWCAGTCVLPDPSKTKTHQLTHNSLR